VLLTFDETIETSDCTAVNEIRLIFPVKKAARVAPRRARAYEQYEVESGNNYVARVFIIYTIDDACRPFLSVVQL